MIGYVTLGTNDREKSARFYDAICGELGAGRMMENDQFIAWGAPGGGAGIGLTRPFNGNAASVGNGVMVAFEAKDRDQVQRLHALALANGGSDEGAPGPRGEGFYAGYFRDPDGNKLNAFLMEGTDAWGRPLRPALRATSPTIWGGSRPGSPRSSPACWGGGSPQG